MLPYISLESIQPLLTVSLVVAQKMVIIQKTFYPSGFYSNCIILGRLFYFFVKINLLFRVALFEV